MIKHFRSKTAQDIFDGNRSRYARRIPTPLHGKIRRLFDQLNAATRIGTLRKPPSNRVEKLTGNLKEFWSLRINRQFRVIFKWEKIWPSKWMLLIIISGDKFMLPKKRPPTHPGKILVKDFLEPMGMTQKAFARHIGWSYARLNEIIHAKRGISVESALDLADVFDMEPQFWLNLQQYWDMWHAMQKHHQIKALQIQMV